MKLYLSPTSPYGRLCLTRAWLLGLNDLQLVFTDPWQNPAELEAQNPFSQIPVLITDSGEVIANSLLICQYLAPQTPSAAELNVIAYAMALLDNTVNAFKLEKKAGESRDHFLVKRNLEAVARALPLAPAFHAASREWPQVMLGVCLLTLKLRYPEIFSAHARADTQQAVAAFGQLPFIQHTNPPALEADKPASIGNIIR
ncbi:MAG: glutathione S-transferase N-terminal domain-containing protein [Neisseria sp.]|nr:glutathione S-transferase N-terminal domain-containing protein [Neisseria sp.]